MESSQKKKVKELNLDKAKFLIKQICKTQSNIPIVLGRGSGIGVIQSLGEMGVKSLVLDDGPVAIRDFSKYCERITIPSSSNNEVNYINHLEKISNIIIKYSNNKPIVFPNSDSVLTLIVRNYDRIVEWATLVAPNASIIDITLNKNKFYVWLKENNFLHPITIFPDNKKDITTLKLSYPCIIKPAHTYKLVNFNNRKLFFVRNRRELEQYCKLLSDNRIDFAIQEFIPGTTGEQYSLAGFCGKEGEINAYIITNRLRENYFGTATLVSSADIDEIFEIGKRVLKALNYNGIFEIEFKKDGRDNKYKIIEINPRCWSQILLATRMNVNVAFYAFSYLISNGQYSKKCDVLKKPKFWVDFEGELYLLRQTNYKIPSLKKILRILSTLPCIEPFNLCDPKPSIIYIKNKISNKIKKGS